ncbi:B-cell receptor CD22-like [Sebastes fasciatus]|uniref:B-cell receptor CD22-like n=1 Tax=Sebastes fasciatus TaxID=394691 RepID=UPI003D9E6E0E
MSVTSAAVGRVLFLLSVSAVQVQPSEWGGSYISTQICASRGSTVDMNCTYRYPSTLLFDKSYWFIHGKPSEDLKSISDYTGRVEYICHDNWCTLRISNLTDGDSVPTYKFRFFTTDTGGKWTVTPGVNLHVTDLQIQLTRAAKVNRTSREADLSCSSSCTNPSYVWFRSGQKVPEEASSSYTGHFGPGDNVSCALKGREEYRSPSLYGPKLPSVSVSPSGEIVEGSSVNLTCSSDANPAANYTWYKEDINLPLLSEQHQLVFSPIQSSDSGQYNCTAENQLGEKTSGFISINVKYGPKRPSVSVSPSGEIVEGSSVTLTCSSDANPAANYTWYKEDINLPLLSEEHQLVFSPIQSSDSGQYNCRAKNQLGEKTTSRNISRDMKYGPKRFSVSVSPSGEIVEGSSVNLTCSSDANPAANYTWYKENQPLLQGPEGIYHLTSISSEDRGIYYCQADNQHGRINSTSLAVDVQYGPKSSSVSVSPSGEIEEGSSVTLTCSSDANPAARYTWYKENQPLLQGPEGIYHLTSISSEDSGSYYCEVQNNRGRRNSTLYLIVVVGGGPGGGQMSIVVGILTALSIVGIAILIFVLLWTRNKRTRKQPSESTGRPDTDAQKPPAEQDGLHYATVRFSKKQADPLYSNTRPVLTHRHEEKVDPVEYATIRFNSTASGSRGADRGEDPAALYSSVNRT